MRKPDDLIVDGLEARLKGFRLGPLSFTAPRGQVTVLLGHNGAGKTTTLRLILGLIRKDGGTVRIGNTDSANEALFRRRIGFVPEEGHYYGQMSVAQLIRFTSGFYPEWDEARCNDAAHLLSLDREKKIRHLSKGTRMKVGLALALARHPDVLLMDESTSGLDPRSRWELLKMIRSAAHEDGRAVLFSTHNLAEAEQVADRVLVLDRGRVLAEEAIGKISREGSLESYYLEVVK